MQGPHHDAQKSINTQRLPRNEESFISSLFTLGNEIYDELKKQNNENKLDSYIYKMLNCIKGNRKDEFTDTAIRVIWSVGKDVPEILVKNCEEVDWKELGHSFISGLTQSKYIKNQEVKENE